MAGYRLTEEEGGQHGPHQLLPLAGGRYKNVFHGPVGTDIGDLHCDLEPYVGVEGEPVVVNHSGWLPNEEQVMKLLAGAHVRLAVWQHPIPPLAVCVEHPICACHGDEMVWVGESFFCPHEEAPDDALEQARKDFTPVED